MSGSEGVWIEVNFRQAQVKGMFLIEEIDEIVALWNRGIEQYPESDRPKETKQFIVHTIETDAHQTKPGAGEMVCGATLWLAADTDPEFRSLLRQGNVTVCFNITGDDEGGYSSEFSIKRSSDA